MDDKEYWATYEGIERPRYTQVPDEMLNGLLPRLGHAEFKVAMCIARKTFGWGKDSDAISLSQLQQGTRLGMTTIKRAVKSLEEKGVLQVGRSRTGAGGAAVNIYSLVIKGGRGVKPLGGRAIEDLPQGQNGPNKKQPLQETNDNERPSSSFQEFITALAAEFAPQENVRAILTYLGNFPRAMVEQAAGITRAHGDGLAKPIAYLYGTLQQLVAEETFVPLYHERAQPLPELTEEERAASLEALDRVKADLREQGIIQ